MINQEDVLSAAFYLGGIGFATFAIGIDRLLFDDPIPATALASSGALIFVFATIVGFLLYKPAQVEAAPDA